MTDTLIKLRKQLHQHPELSGNEENTAKRIIDFVSEYHPSKIIQNLGGHGVAVIYEFGTNGPTVVIRCELDALPIIEKNSFAHQSKNRNVSHKCGHDGHMAIVAGLAPWLQNVRFKKGKVVLLFQPSEETGEGAAKVVTDKKFLHLNPDYVFALHNLPGQPLHAIVLKSGYFSATVQSFCVRLKGKKAHASEPENGINPTVASAALIQLFSKFTNPDAKSEDFALLTPICIDIGEKAYGISPEKAELHYTLRTWSGERMHELEAKIKDAVFNIGATYHLTHEIEWFEFFPATKNDTSGVTLVENIAIQNGLKVSEIKTPLKFGEDFGWFSQKYKSVLFGLGAGETHPSLHHSDFDFPDELINTGLKMFTGTVTEILGK